MEPDGLKEVPLSGHGSTNIDSERAEHSRPATHPAVCRRAKAHSLGFEHKQARPSQSFAVQLF